MSFTSEMDRESERGELPEKLVLAGEFPAAARNDWRKLAEGVLKGAPFERLESRTYNGFKIQPIYERAHGRSPIPGRAPGATWQIMQRVDHPDVAQANALALHDLENGATGLTLVFADSQRAHGFGLPTTPEALVRALDGVYLDAGVAIEFETGDASLLMLAEFAALLEKQSIDPRAVAVRAGVDPISTIARTGLPASHWIEASINLAQHFRKFAESGFRGPFFVADGRVIHDAGGTEVQELAYVIASGVAHLRALESAGVALGDARDMIYARLTADADQFLTMAKFRALRLLWTRIEAACGLQPKPLFVAAETAWRMLTQRDPNVNILRATSAVFSAGLGGANSILVLPHTLALGLPDPLARRIARNTQLILLEESSLAKVADPAAGSGGIETLTQRLCESAWSLFQEIERAGGIVAALETRLLQSKVEAARTARAENVAKRRDPLTGLSEFANLHEGEVPVISHVRGYASFKDKAFEPIRLAEPFERLRDKSDAILAATGARPRVLLANLGTPADYTARATFAKSFFEAGGIEAVELPFSPPFTPTPFQPLPTASAGKSADALVCLCSSDKLYGEQAAAATKALRASGAKHIYLAGRPGDLEADLREAGIGDFIFSGCDAVATLNAAYEMIAR